MAQEQLSMRKIKEVLRLKWACGLPNLAVAASCRISTSSVSDCCQRQLPKSADHQLRKSPEHQ